MVKFKYLIDFFINFLFPPKCIICKNYLIDGNSLCHNCLKKFTFISSPMCNCCGYPFEMKVRENKKSYTCPTCIKKGYKFDKCRSAVIYNDFSKQIILPFKHNDATHFADLISNIMINAGSKLIQDADFLIPVPIHFTRLLKRKYNQSSLICNIISKAYNKEVLYSALKRKTATISQGHLSKKSRENNLKNVFKVNNANLIKDKTILLIDDVFTTGATVNECAKTLKLAGVKKVYVLTFARVCNLSS